MKIVFFLSILFVLMLSACTPDIYLPERTNAPLLHKAGELKLTASTKLQNSPSGSKHGFSPSLDFSASPIKGLGVLASFRSTSRYAINEGFSYGTFPISKDSFHYTGKKGEAGLGYYHPLGAKGILDVYGGGALGNIERKSLKGSGNDYRTQYYQLFVQPGIGFRVKDIFEFGGGVRVNYHKYFSFQSQKTDTRYHFTDQKINIEDANLIFLCPFIDVNVGYKYVKFNVQMGLNSNVNGSLIMENGPLYASMGLTFTFLPRWYSLPLE